MPLNGIMPEFPQKIFAMEIGLSCFIGKPLQICKTAADDLLNSVTKIQDLLISSAASQTLFSIFAVHP
jgi:hypothetical protein